MSFKLNFESMKHSQYHIVGGGVENVRSLRPELNLYVARNTLCCKLTPPANPIIMLARATGDDVR